MALNSQFVAAKQKMRELRAESSKPGNVAMVAEYEKSVAAVNKLAREIQKQKGSIDSQRESLRASGVDVTNLVGEYNKLNTSIAHMSRMQAASGLLGVRSVSSVKAEIAGLVKAYRDIAASSRTSTAEQVVALSALRQKTKELHSTIANPPKLQSARDLLGVSSHSAISAEIAKLRAAYRTLAASGKLSMTELAQAKIALGRRIDELRSKTSGWRDALVQLRGDAPQLLGSLGAVVYPSKVAIEFESSMAKVKKVLDGSQEEVKALGEELQRMSRYIPLTANELAQIAVSGGQLGIAAKEIKPFVETTAKMSTAFDMTAEEAGNAIGKLKNILGVSIEEMGRYGDAISYLGNNSATNEKSIVEVMMRIGGTSKQFGLAKEQAAALAATMLSLGQAPDVAATGINAMLSKMQTATMQSSDFQEALTKIGTSAEEMARMVEADPQRAITSFLNTMKKFSGRQQSEILTAMFGLEYQDDITKLVQGLGVYEETLGLVADKTRYAGTMQKEFDAKMSATREQLKLLRNAGEESAEGVGDVFNEVIKPVSKAFTEILQKTADFTNTFPRMSAAIVGFGSTAIVFGSLAKAVGGAQFVVSSFSASIGAKLGSAGTVVSRMGMMFARASGILTAALTGWDVGTWLNNFDEVKQAGISLASGLSKSWLRMKLVWANLTGGDKAKIIADIQEVDRIYGEMFANVGRDAEQAAERQARASRAIADGSKQSATNQKESLGDISRGAERDYGKVLEWGGKTYSRLAAEAKVSATQQADAHKRASVSMSENARSSYESIIEASNRAKESQISAFNELKGKYQSYASEIKRLQEGLVADERSTAEELRDLKRSTMDPVSAWKDKKSQVNEMKRGLGDIKKAFDEAIRLKDTDEAMRLLGEYERGVAAVKRGYFELATEVKNGDTVYRTQGENVKMVTAEVETLMKQKKSTVDAMTKALGTDMDKMTAIAKKAGLGDLSEGMDAILRKWLENWDKMNEKSTETLVAAKSYVRELAEPTAAIGEAFETAFNAAINTSYEATVKILADIKRIKDEAASIKYGQGSSSGSGMMRGGMVGYRSGGAIKALKLAAGGTVTAYRNIMAGGFLPGFGGGDTVPLWGERGEVMINKYAVKAAGLRAALAFNAGQWDVVIRELMQRTRINFIDSIGYRLGGLIDAVRPYSVMPAQALASGGEVMGGSQLPPVNITLHYHGSGDTRDGRKMAETVMREMQKLYRGRSR